MNDKIWKKCVEFHGHECGGLTIGYKAALYAMELLDIKMGKDCCVSRDEQLVCISENDACGVDAIQVILGCSVGKGNLLFDMCGKQAFSFYNRDTGNFIRLVLKPRPEGLSKGESFRYYQACSFEEMFDVKETKIALPENARIFKSICCSRCGETASENMMHLQGDEILCRDCYREYNRFQV